MPGTCLDILRDVQNQFIMASQNLGKQLVEHEAIAHSQCLPLVLFIPSGLGVRAVQWRRRLTRGNTIWRAVTVRHNAISELVRRTQRKLKVLRVNGSHFVTQKYTCSQSMQGIPQKSLIVHENATAWCSPTLSCALRDTYKY